MLGNNLLWQPSLNSNSHLLENFIVHYPYAAFVRDVNTGRYIIANSVITEHLGFSSIKELLSIRPNELEERLKLVYMTPREKNAIEVINNRVKTAQCSFCNTQICTSYGGGILVEKMLKTPILSHEKTVAILTVNIDITNTVNLFSLFNLYQQRYAKTQAPYYFLKSLGIDRFFIGVPTCAEVSTLLAMYYDPGRKQISHTLNIRPSTVNSHMSRLREKLKNSSELNKLLRQLRERSEYI